METKVWARADFGNRISIKWNIDTFFFIRRETMIFVLSTFIDNRFATSHLLRDSKEILQLVHHSFLSIPDINRKINKPLNHHTTQDYCWLLILPNDKCVLISFCSWSANNCRAGWQMSNQKIKTEQYWMSNQTYMRPQLWSRAITSFI